MPLTYLDWPFEIYSSLIPYSNIELYCIHYIYFRHSICILSSAVFWYFQQIHDVLSQTGDLFLYLRTLAIAMNMDCTRMVMISIVLSRLYFSKSTFIEQGPNRSLLLRSRLLDPRNMEIPVWFFHPNRLKLTLRYVSISPQIQGQTFYLNQR